MKSSKKAYISLLMSVFLISGIAALAYIGVFDFMDFLAMPNPIKVIALVVVFLALFLFIFFLVNLKRGSSKKKKTAVAGAAVPANSARHQNNGLLASGLLAAASSYQNLSGPAGNDETSGKDVIYEENGVPYINSDLAKSNNQGTLNRNFIKLVESVRGQRRA